MSTYEGVLVKRIRAPQVRQNSLARRLFNWGVFTAWMFVVLLFSRTQKDREVVFVSNPPFLPVAIWLVCKLRRWEYTYIVYDLYPDQPVELGHVREGGVVDTAWSALNRRVFLDAEHIVALGPVMKERIAEQASPDFDPDKIEIIHNWEDEDFIQPKAKSDNWFSEEHGLIDTFTVLYSGNIGEFHDLETLVKAASEFEDENITFLVIGEGDNRETIVSLAEELGIRGSTVQFLPYQPWDDLPYSLTSGDVSVVTVKEGFEGVCVSSKLYTAMATGMPVLGIVQPNDDEARLIEVFDAGEHVSQGDVEGVVNVVESWRENPEHREERGANARAAFEEYFTEERSVDRYYQLLDGESMAPDVTERLAVDSEE
jgi:glycosyltransferase involved in cell wall biosynthesis